MRKLTMVSGIFLGVLVLWVGSAVYSGWSKERAAQSASAQRRTKLAAAKPLRVNPGSLVGTWYGRAGNGMEVTLRITGDVSSKPGPSAKEQLNRTPWSAPEQFQTSMQEGGLTGTATIGGLAENCNYSNVAVVGYKAIGNGIILSGTTGNWEMADSLTLTGRLETFGMSGQMTMVPYGRRACPVLGAMPFKLSLVEAPTAATGSADTDMVARVKPITEALQRPYTPLPEVPIPAQLWKDIGVTPNDEQRKETANALRLSDGQLPELLVEGLDHDFCGSGSGCPWSIYGLRSEVTKDGRVSFKYKTLLESQGGVYVLDSVENGYRDVLIDGGTGGSVLKFNGTSYVVTECFSHDYKKLDVVQLTNCQ